MWVCLLRRPFDSKSSYPRSIDVLTILSRCCVILVNRLLIVVIVVNQATRLHQFGDHLFGMLASASIAVFTAALLVDDFKVVNSGKVYV